MTSSEELSEYTAPFGEQIAVFLDQHRDQIAGCLDGLTETEVRARLVPSKTTLLSLVKHATFVESLFFLEAPTGRSRSELGLPLTPDASFDLLDEDTIESVRADFRKACERSRKAVEGVSDDTVWEGNWRGPLTVRWIQIHVLRELAQHCGHVDILREQILAGRTSGIEARG